jgi:threonine/homoserine/homoserine lactone efflux protein
MMKLLRIFFTGIFVSFVGAIPLGTTNLAATQIAITDGLEEALLFSAGLIIADIFYIYLTLLAMQWIQRQKKLFKALEWLTLFIVFSLAASNFYAAAHPGVNKNVLLSNSLPRFVLGLTLNGLNPLQIPFWLGWSTVLFSKNILQPRWKHYNLFAGGASFGFLLALLLFIFGGRLIADKISNNQAAVYYVIGAIFMITGVVQIWKMINRKDVVHQLEHPGEISQRFEETVEGLNKGESDQL